jgi:hypothetical protein
METEVFMRLVYKRGFELAPSIKEKVDNIIQIMELQGVPNLESSDATTEVIVVYTQDSSLYGTAALFFEWLPIKNKPGFISESTPLSEFALMNPEVMGRSQPYKDIGCRWGIDPVDFVKEIILRQPMFSVS